MNAFDKCAIFTALIIKEPRTAAELLYFSGFEKHGGAQRSLQTYLTAMMEEDLIEVVGRKPTPGCTGYPPRLYGWKAGYAKEES